MSEAPPLTRRSELTTWVTQEAERAARCRDGHPADRGKVGIEHRGAVPLLEDGQVIDVPVAGEVVKADRLSLVPDPSPSSRTGPPRPPAPGPAARRHRQPVPRLGCRSSTRDPRARPAPAGTGRCRHPWPPGSRCCRAGPAVARQDRQGERGPAPDQEVGGVGAGQRRGGLSKLLDIENVLPGPVTIWRSGLRLGRMSG